MTKCAAVVYEVCVMMHFCVEIHLGLHFWSTSMATMQNVPSADCMEGILIAVVLHIAYCV